MWVVLGFIGLHKKIYATFFWKWNPFPTLTGRE